MGVTVTNWNAQIQQIPSVPGTEHHTNAIHKWAVFCLSALTHFTEASVSAFAQEGSAQQRQIYSCFVSSISSLLLLKATLNTAPPWSNWAQTIPNLWGQNVYFFLLPLLFPSTSQWYGAVYYGNQQIHNNSQVNTEGKHLLVYLPRTTENLTMKRKCKHQV